MKKFIVFLLIVAAILFAGKLGLEHYYTKKLDEFITQVSSFADIDYRKITIGTDGSISINNLLIEPHAIDTLVRMDAITLFSSDRLLPVNLATFIKRSEFPNELGVRIANLEYDPGIFEPAIRPADKCRYIETTISPQVTAINRLNANLEASIQINSNDAVLSVSSADQTADIDLQVTFDAGSLSRNRSGANPQPIDEITVEYKLDQQVAAELVETCADHLAMSDEEYLNNVVASSSYLRATGAAFGAAANQAMIDLMRGGKWLTINSKPSSQLNNLNNLNFYQAKDIVRLLGLKVAIDAKDVALNVTPLDPIDAPSDENLDDINAADLAAAAEPTQTPLISSAQNDVLAKFSPEEQQRIRQKLQENAQSDVSKYRYQTVAKNNLDRYLNHSIIVNRSGDLKQLAGELIDVKNDMFIIETSQYGGKAQFEIANKDVVEVQVYR
ncbi:hypothetical protein N9060_01435 [Arenicella sp.]|nr:hypothetical protein [Arenicella sp.]